MDLCCSLGDLSNGIRFMNFGDGLFLSLGFMKNMDECVKNRFQNRVDLGGRRIIKKALFFPHAANSSAPHL